MLEKVGTYRFLAEPFHCDVNKRLFLGHVGNLMLNAADFHSRERGFGMTFLNPIHKTWVLSRLAIEMTEMPAQYSNFTIETWIESAMKYFTKRNFRVSDDEGHSLGYGRSVWAMIDTDTRQPQDILAEGNGNIAEWVEPDRPCPIADGSRVKVGDGAQLARRIEMCYSDVDVNGHVNSVKYIEHVLDLFGIDHFLSHDISRFEMAYVAESHQGDVLNIFRESLADGSFNIRITKDTPEDDQGMEVCRSKVKFTKKA